MREFKSTTEREREEQTERCIAFLEEKIEQCREYGCINVAIAILHNTEVIAYGTESGEMSYTMRGVLDEMKEGLGGIETELRSPAPSASVVELKPKDSAHKED